jgi:hypothetical protein
MGVVALTLGIGAALVVRSMPAVWRFVAFALFWIESLGLFQAREKT